MGLKVNLVSVLATVCSGLSSPPSGWRNLPGLAPRFNPDSIDDLGNAVFQQDYFHEHPHLGTTKLSYTAVIPPHVKLLDEHPDLEDISCTESSLILHGTSIAHPDIGDILVASPAFGCHTSEPSGREHGRRLRDHSTEPSHAVFRRVLSSRTDENGDVYVETYPVTQTDCFVNSDISFSWTPPFHDDHPNEAAAKRRALSEDAKLVPHMRSLVDQDEILTSVYSHYHSLTQEDRKLLNLDAIINACLDNSTLSWLGDADIRCNMDVLEFFDFYADLFSVNYDPIADGARERVKYALDDTVRFDNTYANLNLAINAHIKVDSYDLEAFRVTIDGNAHAQMLVTVTDPLQSAEAFLNRAFEELDVGGCMNTIEFWISYIPIRIKPCWDLAVEFQSSDDIAGLSVRTGFLFDAGVSLGVEYDPVTKDWNGVKEWNWQLDYYRPLWNVPTLTTDSMMRFYVIPEVIFTICDIIPLTIYPKPFIGVNFKDKPADTLGRLPSEGMGIWKVKVTRGRGIELPDTVLPGDPYVKVELLGCMDVLFGSNSADDTVSAIDSNTISKDLLYGDHKAYHSDNASPSDFSKLNAIAANSQSNGGSIYGANRTNTTIPIVTNPGCIQQSETKSFTKDPDWDEWLIFEHAPMFQFEAVKNEKIKIELWDDDSNDWFSEDDLLGSIIFDATGAAAQRTSDRIHHVATLDVAGGTLDIEVKWERLTTDELNEYLDAGTYAPEPYDGCWRPDGMDKCSTWEDAQASARRRLKDTCEVDDHLTTCECEGMNTHLNFGFDLALGVGEINFDFDFSYEDTKYQEKRYFSGQLIDFNIWPQTDLVCLDCEGCLAVLSERTSDDGWRFVSDPNEDGVPVGWIKEEKSKSAILGTWIWIIIGIATVAGIGMVVVFAVVGAKRKGKLENVEVPAIFRNIGFKSQVGGSGRKSSAVAGASTGSGRRSSTRGPVTGQRRASGISMTTQQGKRPSNGPKTFGQAPKSKGGAPTTSYV